MRKVSFTTKLTRRFWVVAQSAVSDLSKIPTVAIVDPASLVLPPDMDLTQCMILDQMVERSLLGPGALELELGMKETRTCPTAVGGPVLPAVRAAPEQADKNQCTETLETEPPAKRPCPGLLKKEVSDDARLEQSLEDMAVKIRMAFENSSFHSEDSPHGHSPSTHAYAHFACHAAAWPE